MGLNNIIALMLCIAFAFLIAMPNPQLQGSTGAENVFNKINNASTEIGTSTIAVPINIPVIGTPTFPNPFSLFGALAGLIVTLAGLPQDTITSVQLPTTFALFFITTFTIIGLVLAWSWWKGNNAA